jgi:signal transduction histidine kinase
LHNALKHSGTSLHVVTLRKIANEIQLEVTDRGIGFDVELSKSNRGLGLISMQERVHLLNGAFLVESAPGKGTRVVATLPVVEESKGSATAPGDEPANMTGAA